MTDIDDEEKFRLEKTIKIFYMEGLMKMSNANNQEKNTDSSYEDPDTRTVVNNQFEIHSQIANNLSNDEYKVENDISDDDINRLCNGIDIGDDKPTLEAKCCRYDKGILLTIHEGRYHQIKRMLEALNNHVTYLKRLTFGPLSLDENLESGSSRRLTDEEIDLLRKYM